ncbi:MAG: alpha/beta hydrolase-fold protein [Candidatus Eremiobacteraeota bacterium]|nr:alpha/beta hydrolase-fold protein [Candidatus Eremiobacteraeota bacterium]
MRYTCPQGDNAITFFFPYPDKEKVHVSGDFNGWEEPGWPLYKVEEGWELRTAPLPPGDYGYKFHADGEWFRDPHNALSGDDGFGGMKSIIHVGAEKGSLHHFTFYCPALGTDRGYLIYLPPYYFYTPKRHSTLYLMHGAQDWEWAWLEKASLNGIMDALIHEGLIGEFIVVMARENGDLFKGDHRYGSAIAQNLLGHIDFEFRTIPSKFHRGIDGIATGGYNAFYLGALYHDRYSSVGAMSAYFTEFSYELIRENQEYLRRNDVRFFLSCGQSDSLKDSVRDMAFTLGQLGFYVEHYENPGHHDWDYWKLNYTGALQFHWWSFQRFA